MVEHAKATVGLGQASCWSNDDHTFSWANDPAQVPSTPLVMLTQVKVGGGHSTSGPIKGKRGRLWKTYK